MYRRLSIAVLALLVAIAAMLPTGRQVHCRMMAPATVEACACTPVEVPASDVPACVPVKPCCDVVLLPPHPEEQVAELPRELPVALIVVAAPWLQGPAVAAPRVQSAPVPEWLADGRGASRARPPSYVRFCTYRI